MKSIVITKFDDNLNLLHNENFIIEFKLVKVEVKKVVWEEMVYKKSFDNIKLFTPRLIEKWKWTITMSFILS